MYNIHHYSFARTTRTQNTIRDTYRRRKKNTHTHTREMPPSELIQLLRRPPKRSVLLYVRACVCVCECTFASAGTICPTVLSDAVAVTVVRQFVRESNADRVRRDRPPHRTRLCLAIWRCDRDSDAHAQRAKNVLGSNRVFYCV